MEAIDFTYNVDIVMCIDCTGSMQGLIDTVKQNALKLYLDLQTYGKTKDKYIEQLRVKVISFRDFYADGAKAIEESAFFNIPEEEEKFKATIDRLEVSGEGDETANGLEALALAIKSSWTKEGFRKRHVIVLWTDAS